MTDNMFISRTGDGYQVRIERKTLTVRRYFSYRRYGGKSRAFKAARECRDNLVEQHKPAMSQEGVLVFVNGKPKWVTDGWHGLSGKGRKGVVVS